MRRPLLTPSRLIPFAVVAAIVAVVVAATFQNDYSFRTAFAVGMVVIVFGGVAINLISDAVRSSAKTPPPGSSEVFRNHDIRDLVCHAIVSSVEREVEPLREMRGGVTNQFRDAGHMLAEHFQATIDSPDCPLAELREKNTPEIIRRHISNGNKLFDREHAWRDFILSAPSSRHLTDIERADLASALERHFGEALWNLLKIDGGSKGDSAGGGRAQTGFQMLSMARIEDKIDGLAKVPAAPAIGPLHTIPPPPPGFTGRVEELEELRAAAGPGGAVITGLRGMGGIGKTALALVLAREWASRFPDAALMLDGKGLSGDAAPSAAKLMEQVILAFYPEAKLPDDSGAIAGIYQSVLHKKKVLILLDNAKDAAQAKPLLPPDGCALIVTSRAGFAIDGCAPYAVGRMKDAEAESLLLVAYPGLTEAEVAELLRLCAGLPLALKLAASHLALDAADRGGAADVAGYLGKLGGGCLAHLDADAEDAGEITISETLRLSVETLAEDERRAWQKLGIFITDFEVEAAEAIAGAGEEMLGRFLRRSLLEPVSAGRYKLHDLAADYARTRLSVEEKDGLALAHAGYYQAVGDRADNLYIKGEVLAGLTLFDRERAQIETAFTAMQARRDEPAAERIIGIANAIAYVGNLRFHARQQIGWLESQLRAARQTGSRKAEGNALGNLGTAHAGLGNARTAIGYYEQQLDITREIGDRHGEGNALGNLGIAHATLGDARMAIGYYEQRLEIAREIGDRRGEGNAFGNLGIAHRNLGDARTAIGYHEQALEVSREIGDRRGEGQDLGNLGLAHAALGDTRTAIGHHEQTLVIMREIGDRRGEGNALGNLGNVHAGLGDARTAIGCYEQQLEIAREIGDRRGEGAALWNSVSLFREMGDHAEAIARAEEALAIYESIESPHTATVRAKLAEWRGETD